MNCCILQALFKHWFPSSLNRLGPTQKMNLFQSVTSALDNTLASDPTAGRMLKQEVEFNAWKYVRTLSQQNISHLKDLHFLLMYLKCVMQSDDCILRKTMM